MQTRRCLQHSVWPVIFLLLTGLQLVACQSDTIDTIVPDEGTSSSNTGGSSGTGGNIHVDPMQTGGASQNTGGAQPTPSAGGTATASGGAMTDSGGSGGTPGQGGTAAVGGTSGINDPFGWLRPDCATHSTLNACHGCCLLKHPGGTRSSEDKACQCRVCATECSNMYCCDPTTDPNCQGTSAHDACADCVRATSSLDGDGECAMAHKVACAADPECTAFEACVAACR